MTGDNGAPSDQCEYGGLNVPWNGTWLTNTYNGNGGTGKTTTWEGGHREPGLAVWPTQIQPKTTSHATISALDILPTFAALAGVNLPSHRVIDGVDISNILFDGAMSTSRSALYHPNSGCEGQIGVVETVQYSGSTPLIDVCDAAVQNGCASVNKAACSAGTTTCGGCLTGFKSDGELCVDKCDAAAKTTCSTSNKETCTALTMSTEGVHTKRCACGFEQEVELM